MSFKPLVKLWKNDQLSAFISSSTLLKPFYKLVFLAAAKENGLLDLLSSGPVKFEQLAETYCKNDRARQALEAWLQLGVRLGFLKMDTDGFALKGLAKKLALPQNDGVLALLQEVAGLHHKLIFTDSRQTSRRRTLGTRRPGWRTDRKIVAGDGSIPD